MRLDWTLLVLKIVLLCQILEVLSIPQTTASQAAKNLRRSLNRRFIGSVVSRTSEEAAERPPLPMPPRLRVPSSQYTQTGSSEDLGSKPGGLHTSGVDVHSVEEPRQIGEPKISSTPDHPATFTGDPMRNRWIRLKSPEPPRTWGRCFPQVHNDCLWTGGLRKMLRATRKFLRWLEGKKLGLSTKHSDPPKIPYTYGPNRKLPASNDLPPENPLEEFAFQVSSPDRSLTPFWNPA